MARKKYPYDEAAKNRIVKCLKANYEEVRLTVKKGTKERYKSYAASKGMSMTALITALVEREMEADGFQPDKKESAED